MIKKKYKEFADKFENLCEEYKDEDFNGDELVDVCIEVIANYCE